MVDKIDRGDILARAREITTGDRRDAYGSPGETHEAIAAFWKSHMKIMYDIDVPLRAQDVAWMMLYVKISRCKTSPDRGDNYVDAAAYAAIAGECAEAEREW